MRNAMSAQHSCVKLVGLKVATKLHKRIVSFTMFRLAGTRKITSSLQVRWWKLKSAQSSMASYRILQRSHEIPWNTDLILSFFGSGAFDQHETTLLTSSLKPCSTWKNMERLHRQNPRVHHFRSTFLLVASAKAAESFMPRFSSWKQIDRNNKSQAAWREPTAPCSFWHE